MEQRLVTEMLLPKFIQNLFTYAEGYEVRDPLYVLLKENYCLKAELIEISQIHLLSLNSKFLIERNPCFFDNLN